MNRRILPFWLCLAAAAAGAQPQPDAERAREAAWLLARGEHETLAARFPAGMRQALTPEALRKAVGAQLQELGEVRRIGEPEMTKSGAFVVAFVPVEFERGPLRVRLSFDSEGRIAGLFLRPPAAPAWTRPLCSAPDKFDGRERTAGAPCWPLPATVTTPRGDGTFPALVLVHGSGPSDRDGTVGAAKPFRDLAEGLASRGVAALRYEKHTRRHAARLAESKPLTPLDEVIDDTLSALGPMRQTPGVDPQRFFLLGQSPGGWAAPARPLGDLDLDQVRYLLPRRTANAELAREKLA